MERFLLDVEILTRNYSNYRGGCKWVTYSQNSLPKESYLSSDGLCIIVYKQCSQAIDFFPIFFLSKRQTIKRSPSFFRSFNKLWLTINPSFLKAISKQVYIAVIEAFYQQFHQSLGNPDLIQINLIKDSEEDFKGKSGLTFAEFYDVVFEVVDGIAKSSLVGEYSRIVFNTAISLNKSASFMMLNLYSRIHLKDIKGVVYYNWMHKIFRDLTPQKSNGALPEIVKNSYSSQSLPKYEYKNSVINAAKNELDYRVDSQRVMKHAIKSKSPVIYAANVLRKRWLDRSPSFNREKKSLCSMTLRKQVEDLNDIKITKKIK